MSTSCIYQGHRIKFVKFLKQYSAASCAICLAASPVLLWNQSSGSSFPIVGGAMLLNVASTVACQNLLKRYVLRVFTSNEDSSTVRIETLSLLGRPVEQKVPLYALSAAPGNGALLWQWKAGKQKFMIDIGLRENKEFCRLVRQVKANSIGSPVHD
jgi:hypothetical protein